MLSQEGGCKHAILKRIQTGWLMFKEPSGLLIGKGMSLRSKGIIYTTCIRPVMLYGSETWPTKVEDTVVAAYCGHLGPGATVYINRQSTITEITPLKSKMPCKTFLILFCQKKPKFHVKRFYYILYIKKCLRGLSTIDGGCPHYTADFTRVKFRLW